MEQITHTALFFISNSDMAFAAIPECIKEIISYIGNRFKEGTTDNALYLKCALTSEERANIQKMGASKSLNIIYIGTTESYKGKEFNYCIPVDNVNEYAK